MLKFYVVLRNSSECELDRVRIEPKNEDAITAAVVTEVSKWVLAAGDTILIEEIE